MSVLIDITAGASNELISLIDASKASRGDALAQAELDRLSRGLLDLCFVRFEIFDDDLRDHDSGSGRLQQQNLVLDALPSSTSSTSLLNSASRLSLTRQQRQAVQARPHSQSKQRPRIRTGIDPRASRPPHRLHPPSTRRVSPRTRYPSVPCNKAIGTCRCTTSSCRSFCFPRCSFIRGCVLLVLWMRRWGLRGMRSHSSSTRLGS